MIKARFIGCAVIVRYTNYNKNKTDLTKQRRKKLPPFAPEGQRGEKEMEKRDFLQACHTE